MSKVTSRSAISVSKVLDAADLQCEVIELPSSTRTALDASHSIGCDIGQIVKTLVFKTNLSQLPVLVLASGPNIVNERLIETLVGEPISKADANFVRNVTGFAIGGVPPIGHKVKINWVFFDKCLLEYEQIWAAAGTPNAVFSIEPKTLCTFCGATIFNS